jgi:hypothetical protein
MAGDLAVHPDDQAGHVLHHQVGQPEGTEGAPHADEGIVLALGELRIEPTRRHAEDGERRADRSRGNGTAANGKDVSAGRFSTGRA